MEPRKTQKTVKVRRAAGKRFRIVKLEERIAPGCSYHANPHGKYVGHYSGRGCGGR